MAGCILVDEERIQVINRSASYKNKYVHRRTSVSLSDLTPEQIEEQRKLGLVRDSVGVSGACYLEDEQNDYGYDDDEGGRFSLCQSHKPKW